VAGCVVERKGVQIIIGVGGLGNWREGGVASGGVLRTYSKVGARGGERKNREKEETGR